MESSVLSEARWGLVRKRSDVCTAQWDLNVRSVYPAVIGMDELEITALQMHWAVSLYGENSLTKLRLFLKINDWERGVTSLLVSWQKLKFLICLVISCSTHVVGWLWIRIWCGGQIVILWVSWQRFLSNKNVCCRLLMATSLLRV